MLEALPVLLTLVAAPDAGPPPVTVGGQVRMRGELKRQADLDAMAKSVAMDGERVLLRSRITVTANPSQQLRLVVQAQDSRVFGQEATSATDLANLDVHQAWLQAAGPAGLPLTVRIGRFPLSYGDQRLMGGLEWSNVARSFDAVRVRGAALDHLTVDAFWARLHADPSGDRALGDDLVGLYAWWNQPMLTVDAYGLYLRDGGEREDSDLDLSLLTVGARVDARLLKGLVFNGEAAVQRGERGELDVAAWAAHASLSYSLPLPVSPKLEVGWDRATGDADASDGTWGTFENLFPTNHMHYGFIDMAAWKNLQDVWAGIGLSPIEGLTLLVRGNALARLEAGDTFYRADGKPLRDLDAATAVDAQDVGKELDVLLRWKAMEGLSVLAGWSVLLSGAFLDATDVVGDAPNPSFGYLQVVGGF